MLKTILDSHSLGSNKFRNLRSTSALRENCKLIFIALEENKCCGNHYRTRLYQVQNVFAKVEHSTQVIGNKGKKENGTAKLKNTEERRSHVI